MKLWRSTLLSAALLGAAAVIMSVSPPASAQIAGAIGRPLQSPDLPEGTISVRIVAGSPSSPVIGADVTLLVNDTPRVARTDSAGRATFKDLPVGATVQAKAIDEDKKEMASEAFPVPAGNGARLMLSTRPFKAMGGGPATDPRQESGEPRAEPSNPPGTFTVQLTYGDVADPAPPVGLPVLVVGYGADDSVSAQIGTTDKSGRATFIGLDRTGATSYFAMAQLPRGNGIDRMISTPIVLDSRSGVAVTLSAETRASTEPPVDDVAKLDKQEHLPEAGKVRISIDTIFDASSEVRLLALRGGAPGVPPARREVAHLTPKRSAIDPRDIKAQAQFSPKADVPTHNVHVQVHGGAGVNQAIAGAGVKLVPANGPPGNAAEVKTPTDGYVELQSPSNDPVIAVITVNGKELRSQPLDLAKSGGELDVVAQWDGRGRLDADFDVSSIQPDEIVFAESSVRGTTYRTIPFQPVAGRGTQVTLYVFPRVIFSFSLTSRVDDEFLAVQGRFKVANNSWAPYIGGPDGLVIPLPAHFKGAVVAAMDQGDVAIAQGEGFRISRPIPPGGKQFHGGFSLPVDNGTIDWHLDLPLGSLQSEMEILQTPGMSVQLPGTMKGQTATVPQGTFFVLPSISIPPKQSMEMSITNLPSPAVWRKWAPRLVGIAAVVIMLAGLGFALQRTTATRAAGAARTTTRAKLLDELVELERTGKDAKRRAEITAQLEELWDDAG